MVQRDMNHKKDVNNSLREGQIQLLYIRSTPMAEEFDQSRHSAEILCYSCYTLSDIAMHQFVNGFQISLGRNDIHCVLSIQYAFLSAIRNASILMSCPFALLGPGELRT